MVNFLEKNITASLYIPQEWPPFLSDNTTILSFAYHQGDSLNTRS